MSPPKMIVHAGTTYFLDNLNISPEEDAEEVVAKLHWQDGYNRLVGAEMRRRRQDEEQQQEEKRNGGSSFAREAAAFPDQQRQAPRQDRPLGAGANTSGLQEWPSVLNLCAEDGQFPISGKFAVVLKDELKTRLEDNPLHLRQVRQGLLVEDRPPQPQPAMQRPNSNCDSGPSRGALMVLRDCDAKASKKVTLGHLVNFLKLVVTSPPEASGLGINMTLNWRMQDAVSVYREVRQAVLELTKEAYHHHWPRNLPLQCFTPHGSY